MSTIKGIFKNRAEKRAKLQNVTVMRTSNQAIARIEKMIVAYAEALSDEIMDVTKNSGLNTVYERHVSFYAEKFAKGQKY